MTSPELERLVAANALKREPPTIGEVEGLIRSGRARLADARRTELSMESQFDLAYNAAHSLALAALRRLGLRPTNGECSRAATSSATSRSMEALSISTSES